MEHGPLKEAMITLAAMRSDRSSWDAEWRDLGDLVMPRSHRFNASETNRGGKRSTKIVDGTATFSLRTLSAGMMSGVTSPARPWFELTLPDKELAKHPPVKSWLWEVTKTLRSTLLGSNVYRALPSLYSQIGLYGTAAMTALEDDDKGVRFYNHPIGSFLLAQNDRLMVDTFAREFMMTARQLLKRFGPDNVSRNVHQLMESNNGEERLPVIHMIRPNPDADPDKLHAKHKAFTSRYFEADRTDGGFLSEGGFDEFPTMAPRWDTTGEDIYGSDCPGMVALPDIQQLQFQQKRKAKGIDKQIDPPMTGPTSMRNSRATIRSGDITYIDTREGQQGFRAAHEVRFQLEGVLNDIYELKQSVRRSYYEDLFLMMATDPRTQPPTAREVAERHEEKLLALGPVLERLNDELLDPLIDRVFAIALRRGMLPPPPPELEGAELAVEYVSIMAQAQKLVGVSSVDRLLNVAGGIAQFSPDVVDKINSDRAIDIYAEMLGTPPDLIRSEEEAAEIRQQRAEQQQQQQQAEQAQMNANTAETLSKTDMQNESALKRLLAARGVPGA